MESKNGDNSNKKPLETKLAEQTAEIKEIVIEDKDGNPKKLKATIRRSTARSTLGIVEADLEGFGTYKIEKGKITDPDGKVTNFGPPRREGNKLIFPDGRTIEIKESAPPPLKGVPNSQSQIVNPPQEVASTSLVSPATEGSASSSESHGELQSQYPYGVKYIAPGAPECDDDAVF